MSETVELMADKVSIAKPLLDVWGQPVKISSLMLCDPLIKQLKLLEGNEVDALLTELSAISTPTTIAFLNQHGYNIAHNQPSVRRHLLQMNYLLRDGIGIKVACKLNGRAPKANLNGSDFIPKLINHLTSHNSQSNYQFFAMGTRDPWLTRGAQALFGNQPFHAIDGFQPLDTYLDFLDTHRTPEKITVIVLAMGIPKQEQIAAEFRRQLKGPVLVICGGAILDFAAQRVKRAPKFVRQMGMEWFFRWLMEPRRLFKRYAIGIPQFFYYVMCDGLATKIRVGQQSMGNREN